MHRVNEAVYSSMVNNCQREGYRGNKYLKLMSKLHGNESKKSSEKERRRTRDFAP